MSQPKETPRHVIMDPPAPQTPDPNPGADHYHGIPKASGIQYAFGSTFSFGGIDVPFDATDVETLQRFEEGVANLRKDEASRPKDGKASVVSLEFCKMYERFFDNLFGEGVFLRMCGGKYSMAVSQKLYATFLETMAGQAQSFQAIKAGFAKQYLPNRAARRAKR